MQDRVGSVVPSEKEVAKLIDELHALQKKIEKFTIALSTEDRKHTLRFRPGGERIIALVGDLVTKHALQLPKVSVDAMKADLALSQRLAALDTAAQTFAQRIADTRLEAEAESWWAATAYYTALARMADAEPELANALRTVVDFFATGRRSKKAAAEQTDPAVK
jgi:hypothetical protein